MGKTIPVFLLPLLFIYAVCWSQKAAKNDSASLKDVVARIKVINQVQSKQVGLYGVGENYFNFAQLKRTATVADLIKLLDYPNNTVACYAAMALADTAYPGLKVILAKFIDKKRPVNVIRGCLSFTEDISTELYLEYWNNLPSAEKKTDKILMELDSVVLYSENADWLLVYKALEKRIYSNAYKAQIEVLAFEKHNTSAITYLYNWCRIEYAERLQQALLRYLEKTDFSNEGVGAYYQTVIQLLSFNDPSIKQAVIKKMQKDRFWEMDKENYKYLLAELHLDANK